ncbi:M61 family metallopeptidase [Parachryseolinea silvisoli]|uniref:M61 family metallopeptidase n=1 Tax=Parachryseolinea silvisoli TaxID=2873601 RepID=UPI0022658ECE|nr:M61 family peptidase [Parachryseolinea silvisoli]MCD9020101.1 M61 family peptidase [Parachryseolinea silvisoli]
MVSRFSPMRLRFSASLLLSLLLVFVLSACQGQGEKSSLAFTVSMPKPANQVFEVELVCENLSRDTVVFKMPAWMPGLYQVRNYADHVLSFSVKDGNGKAVRWEKAGRSGWRVFSQRAKRITLQYSVKATMSFVAANFLYDTHGYIAPTGLFMHADGVLQHPVTVTLKPAPQWNRVATGLDSVAGKKYTYTAPDFDVLYDSPILLGNLEELPAFTVHGVPHRFIGYKLGSFDRKVFMKELKRSVTLAADLIGDIPYKHYTFIAIGPGRGGIEHLNSTAVSFDGNELNNPEGRERMLSFLSHEYFHHYNVKRIRPVELGPFDYERENRTNLLWVSEGFTSYYEYIMLRRSGLITREAFLSAFQRTIASYENNAGRLYQSLVQASYNTWDGNPFERPDVSKTVSYYDKGTAMGLLLDLGIRQASGNKQSLDDVMRYLYRHYYQDLKRGFTDAEFQQACEAAAGTPLKELFEYVYTTKPVDYVKYLAYAGLAIDITVREGKASFAITPLATPDAQQSAILKSWLGE